jgi:hypothetical protein
MKTVLRLAIGAATTPLFAGAVAIGLIWLVVFGSFFSMGPN